MPLRQLGSGSSDQLEGIVQAGLVEEGRVFLLSLEPIAVEFAARWAAREERVWETFERALTRALPAPDQFVRLDPVTLLAAVRSSDAYAAQVRCAQVLRETLAFFLGRQHASDLRMSRVTALDRDSLVAQPIDPTLPTPPVVSSNARAASQTLPDPSGHRRQDFMLDMDRDGPVRLRATVEPILRVDRRSVAAFAVRRHLPRPIDSYTDDDQRQIDQCVVAFLEPLMTHYKRNFGSLAIFCPLTFATLASQTSRQALVGRCASVLDVMRQALIVEMDGLGKGAPDGRIRETLSMCRGLSRLKTISIATPTCGHLASGGYGADGLAVELDAFTEAQLKSIFSRAKGQTSNIIAHGVVAGSDLAALGDQGVSHVSELVD